MELLLNPWLRFQSGPTSITYEQEHLFFMVIALAILLQVLLQTKVSCLRPQYIHPYHLHKGF